MELLFTPSPSSPLPLQRSERTTSTRPPGHTSGNGRNRKVLARRRDKGTPKAKQQNQVTNDRYLLSGIKFQLINWLAQNLLKNWCSPGGYDHVRLKAILPHASILIICGADMISARLAWNLRQILAEWQLLIWPAWKSFRPTESTGGWYSPSSKKLVMYASRTFASRMTTPWSSLT